MISHISLHVLVCWFSPTRQQTISTIYPVVKDTHKLTELNRRVQHCFFVKKKLEVSKSILKYLSKSSLSHPKIKPWRSFGPSVTMQWLATSTATSTSSWPNGCRFQWLGRIPGIRHRFEDVKKFGWENWGDLIVVNSG